MAILLRQTLDEGELTYKDIWERVQNLIDDADPGVLNIIKEAIHMVYEGILARYRGKTQIPRWMVDYDTALSTAADTRETNLATADKNVERILKVSIQSGSSWYRCDPIDIEELENNPNLWLTTNKQRPTRFFHKKSFARSGGETNSLIWFYLPDAVYSIRYWLEMRISPLTSETDVPLLPVWAHPAIIYGTLVQLSQFDIRIKAGPWGDFYSLIISRLDMYNMNFVLNTPDAKGWGI